MADKLSVLALQLTLQKAGLYAGIADGDMNPFTIAAIDAALSHGDHGKLSDGSIAAAASRLLLTPAHIGACYDVESTGHGFDPDTGKPIIRFEPHIFQKRTGGRWNGEYPALSHAYADRDKYPQPSSQKLRWGIVYEAMQLDADAAFSATSFGLFQVMGFNFGACGYPDLWTFVSSLAASEAVQLNAFCGFLKSQGLADKLRAGDWSGYARWYNGPGFDSAPGRADDYDMKLQRAYAARGGK